MDQSNIIVVGILLVAIFFALNKVRIPTKSKSLPKGILELTPEKIVQQADNKLKKEQQNDFSSGILKPDENYITPTTFEVGVIKPTTSRSTTGQNPFEYANNCNPTVLYPINGLEVKYGSKGPAASCPCAQFVLPP